ncbi:RNA-binding S4 domain-containing protein [Motilimonas sp. KMU-193]|uniref:RNA-binding S4 domain-containing protein n=1 Tax=Motilimonas sp. KMU-193 TaxID=3388668 RepID=UPI00396B2A22
MSEEIEIEAIGIEVSAQPIELYKVLKIANAVSGGGEAKMAISEGYVALNGEVETRKRCKVYDGDVIQFNGEFYLVLCDAPVEEVAAKAKPKAKPESEPLQKAKKAQPSKSTNQRSAAKSQKAKQPKANAGAKNQSKQVSPTQIDKQTGRREIKF